MNNNTPVITLWKGKESGETFFETQNGKSAAEITGAPLPAPVTKAVAKPAPKKVVPAKKEEIKREPVKELRGTQQTVMYYGKELIKFTEEDVRMSYNFMIIKCKDTVVVIEGKCKNVMIENCQNVKVVVNELLAAVEVLNSKKVTVQALKKLPQFIIERSDSINLYLFESAKTCKINSTCSQSMVIHYPKKDATEDDEWIDQTIPETLITVIKDDKLETKCMDGFE